MMKIKISLWVLARYAPSYASKSTNCLTSQTNGTQNLTRTIAQMPFIARTVTFCLVPFSLSKIISLIFDIKPLIKLKAHVLGGLWLS